MTQHMTRLPVYDGLSVRYPEPCSCCQPAHQMPVAFANNATLTDPVLRHHANIGNGRSSCGFDDCSICGPEVPEGA